MSEPGHCPDCREPWDLCWCEYDRDDDFDPDCQTCAGEGWVPGDELSDPLWYLPDEIYTCPNCRGSGLAKDQTYW